MEQVSQTTNRKKEKKQNPNQVISRKDLACRILHKLESRRDEKQVLRRGSDRISKPRKLPEGQERR